MQASLSTQLLCRRAALALLYGAFHCVGCSLIMEPRRLPAADAAPPDHDGGVDLRGADLRADLEAEGGPDADGPCALTPSGPVVAARDGQIIEKLRITATAGDAVTVTGKTDVVIRDCEIHHTGGHGIAFSGAHGLRIERVVVVHDGAPASGPNGDPARDNINGEQTERLVIDGVRLIRGAAGIHLVATPAAELRLVEGHDFRGPEPKGQFVRLESCHGALLENFSCVNPPSTSWPESIISVQQSSDVTVRRGLVDGCNAPTGNGVLFVHTDGASSGGLCEDVDALHMSNGCFSCYPARDVTFRRTRCRDNICSDQGRGPPESKGQAWTGHPDSEGLEILDSTYYNVCAESLIWLEDDFSPLEVREQDFTPRPPIALSFCWDAAQP